MSNVITRIVTAVTESAARVRLARQEGVLTLTEPKDAWVLKVGHRVRDAHGREGVVDTLSTGAKVIQFHSDGPATSRDCVEYPATILNP